MYRHTWVGSLGWTLIPDLWVSFPSLHDTSSPKPPTCFILLTVDLSIVIFVDRFLFVTTVLVFSWILVVQRRSTLKFKLTVFTCIVRTVWETTTLRSSWKLESIIKKFIFRVICIYCFFYTFLKNVNINSKTTQTRYILYNNIYILNIYFLSLWYWHSLKMYSKKNLFIWFWGYISVLTISTLSPDTGGPLVSCQSHFDLRLTELET